MSIGLNATVFQAFLGNANHFLCKRSAFHKEYVGRSAAADDSCWKIYCIFDKTAGAVKVGVSTNPSERLATLQTGNPNFLYLGIVRPLQREDGSFLPSKEAKKQERLLHEKLAHLRMPGGTEWFQACDDQRRIVELHFGLKGSIGWAWGPSYDRPSSVCIDSLRAHFKGRR